MRMPIAAMFFSTARPAGALLLGSVARPSSAAAAVGLLAPAVAVAVDVAVQVEQRLGAAGSFAHLL
jgi:hypothetical protein